MLILGLCFILYYLKLLGTNGTFLCCANNLKIEIASLNKQLNNTIDCFILGIFLKSQNLGGTEVTF